MEAQSIIHTTNLPEPVFSSGVFSHRKDPLWRAQVCIAGSEDSEWIVWVEHKEGFSDGFDIIAKTQSAEEGYKQALSFLKRRGYITDSFKELNI